MGARQARAPTRADRAWLEGGALGASRFGEAVWWVPRSDVVGHRHVLPLRWTARPYGVCVSHNGWAMRMEERIARSLAVTSLAARVYLGYKAITVAEQRLGIKDGAERRSRHHTDSARRLYELAIRRQGLLIKFGQIIGSRPDLVPDEYIGVLSRLQDQVPPRSFEVIKRRVERAARSVRWGTCSRSSTRSRSRRRRWLRCTGRGCSGRRRGRGPETNGGGWDGRTWR